MISLVLSSVVAVSGIFGDALWIASSDAEATPKFVRRFTVGEGLSSASLAVTGVGFCEAALNGVRVGDRLLDPSPTDYTKRVYYSVFPVTPRVGENELAILVGHGWYDQRSEGWSFESAPWRGKPRAIAALTLKYANGKTETIATDGSWREVASGIRYDDIREGEWQDGTMAAFDRAVEVVKPPAGALVEADFPGAKKQERFVPKSIERLAEDAWIVDFGVQMSGWARFAPKDAAALRGRKVDFRYDERKPPQPRHIDQFAKKFGKKGFKADGEAFQTDHRRFAGRAGEAYEPHVVYHGFRYLTIYGLGRAPTADELTAWQVNSDMMTVGSFECSDPIFNELMRMVDRSYRSNFTDGVPTDCPHREKNGWTGDASLASRYAQYQYENTACYRKWLRDLLDAQRVDGALPGIVPTPGWGFDFKPWATRAPGPAWDSALPVIAWHLHLYRGDDTLLPQVLPALEKNLDYTWSRRRPNDLIDESLGEWCPIGDKPDSLYVLTAYFIGNCRIGAAMADCLKDERRAAKFRALAAQARTALRKAFSRGNGGFADESQTAQALALAFGLCDSEAEKRQAQNVLIRKITEAKGHFNVGILGFDKLGEVLRDIGENRLYYRMLVNPTEPSPRASWLDKGLTTLAENFDRSSSWDHIMFGSFGAWAYSDLAGLAPCADGSADYVIRPDPIRELTFVRARTDFGKGEIASAWTRKGDSFRLTVCVPSGRTARVMLPDGATSVVGAGEHSFSCVLLSEKPIR